MTVQRLRTRLLGPHAYAVKIRQAATLGWRWTGVTIPSVHDGDTIDALVSRSFDAGFGNTLISSYRVRLRLARINAPALSSADGEAAQSWLAELLMGGDGAPAPDLVVTTLDAYKYGGPSYSPGEWMAEVILPDGRNVSDLAVATGHAVFWDGHGLRPDDGATP